MDSRFVERADAKINLYLEVGPRRPDGYHDIVSIMASVDVHDILTLTELVAVSPAETVISIEPDGGREENILLGLPVEQNLVTRAARAYLAGRDAGAVLRVRLRKEIPAGGGLGGGSSDAAAVLRLLNRVLGWYDTDGLARIAAGIGADVTFCLFGGMALCEGVGDRITPVHYSGDHMVVIVNDCTQVATGPAYALVDGMMDREGRWNRSVPADELLASAGRSDFSSFFNDFEKPVFSAWPNLERIKAVMNQYSPELCLMTGSGATVIGIFSDRTAAKAAAADFGPACRAVARLCPPL